MLRRSDFILFKRGKVRGRERGFTLIELLIVIAILGILIAIAIPAYLGQREKARYWMVVAGARGAVSEIQAYLDSMVSGLPFVLLDSTGQEICVEPSPSGLKNCMTVYDQAANTTYFGSGNFASSLVPFIINHHAGKGEKSPFNPGSNLFTDTSGVEGTIVLTPTDNRVIRIQGYARDTVNAVYDKDVTVR